MLISCFTFKNLLVLHIFYQESFKRNKTYKKGDTRFNVKELNHDRPGSVWARKKNHNSRFLFKWHMPIGLKRNSRFYSNGIKTTIKIKFIQNIFLII